MSRRVVALWLVAVVLIGVILVLMPRGESADATLALRRFLASSGLRISAGEAPPASGGTFVLLRDLRDEEDARALLRWAARGGRLVVADPSSAIVPLSGARPANPIALVGQETLEPACIAEEVVGVGRIVARASDWTLAPDDPFVSCFPAGRGGFVLVRDYGQGKLVLVGGISAFTNELLRSPDNALLALRLVGSGPDVVFGPPVPRAAGGPSGSLWAVLPVRAKVLIIGVGLAAVAFALVRGRRLGQPVLEEPLAPIPASELVRATARLYRRGRTAGYSGRLMRDATRARIARRLEVRGKPDELPAILARITGMSPDRLGEALSGPGPSSDDELIRLGILLHEVESRVGERPR
jgi:hypothetical protein